MLAGTTFSEFAGFVGRGLRGLGRGSRDDGAQDPFERVPADPDAQIDGVETPISDLMVQEEELRASERLERDTMMLIRGALYPAD